MMRVFLGMGEDCEGGGWWGRWGPVLGVGAIGREGVGGIRGVSASINFDFFDNLDNFTTIFIFKLILLIKKCFKTITNVKYGVTK